MSQREDDFDNQWMEDPMDYAPEVQLPSERAERAREILDEIGLISGSAQITSNAILFVEDMQKKLRASRDRKTAFFCSEKQLEWLEAIYEKVS